MCGCSLNVAMSNLVDTIIDYPNSKIYIEQLCARMQELNCLTEEQVGLYKKHTYNIENRLDTDV